MLSDSNETPEASDVAAFVAEHPDCSSLDIADAFGITVAKSFTILNELVDDHLAFKTTVRSPTNRKRIFGYRMVPGYDQVMDNGDGSMKDAQVIKLVRRRAKRDGEWSARKCLDSHNEWRRYHHLPEIPEASVFGA